MSCSGQCSGCAFKVGAAAFEEIENRMTGAISAMAANPFYCHETLKWQGPADKTGVARETPAVMREKLLKITLPGKEPRACAGWKAAVAELAVKGWFQGQSAPLRRSIARRALHSLIMVRSNQTRGRRTVSRKNRAMKDLTMYLQVLQADIEEMRIDPRVLGMVE